MRILVACEFSGVVREAFASYGHDAHSCDFLPTEIPGQHWQESVELVLAHCGHFDIMIAFPPCTHLAISGARWFQYKYKEQNQAVEFVRMLMNQSIQYIAIENPIGIISTKIRKPDQIIQPWMFGHGETKATCLWLKNLPKLVPTNIVNGRHPRIWYEPPSKVRWMNRSRMYKGIAEAMAKQWSGL